jgi:hypothetical protein
MSNIENLSEADYWIAHQNATRMEITGGGFHSSLGKLFFRADMQSAAKLVNAFPEQFLRVAKPTSSDSNADSVTILKRGD